MVIRKHKHRKHRLPFMAFLAICAIVAVNSYALHELMALAQSWKTSLLPGSVSTQLTHLAIILGINCIAIVYLLIDRFSR